MSGIPRFGSGKIKPEPLKKRPDFQLEGPTTLPGRSEIRVVCSINKRMEPLARVTKGLGQSLSLEVSDYIAHIALVGVLDTLIEKQALQTFIHEMMHMALWDDVSISHSPDKKSILYYYVDGSNLEPTSWDLEVMIQASRRIGHIIIERRNIQSVFLEMAVTKWNVWLKREFFVLE